MPSRVTSKPPVSNGVSGSVIALVGALKNTSEFMLIFSLVLALSWTGTVYFSVVYGSSSSTTSLCSAISVYPFTSFGISAAAAR